MSVGRLIVLALAIAAASRLGALRRRRAVVAAQRRLEQDLPDTIDLLIVLVRAGLTPAQAVPELASTGPHSWRAGWCAVETALVGGVRFIDALDRLVEVVGAPARVIVDTLVAADHYGQPLAPALDRLSIDGQAARRRAADTAARQLPVRLSFPLVCCTLPAFVLLTIAPLIVGAVSSLHT